MRFSDLAERSNNAQQVLATYLDLSSNTSQLFKQLSDAARISGHHWHEGENALQLAIEADISPEPQLSPLGSEDEDQAFPKGFRPSGLRFSCFRPMEAARF